MPQAEDRLARAERMMQESGARVMVQIALVGLFRRHGHHAAVAEARAMLDTVQASLLLAREQLSQERRARGLDD